MTLADTLDRVKSGVLNINFIDVQNRLVGKGTGFMCSGYLITNNHVFRGPENSRVWIRRFDHSETSLADGLVLDTAQFRQCLAAGSPPELHDYAILDIEALRRWNVHQFSLRDPIGLRTGDGVAFLGYPLDHSNLTCHSGIVSSRYSRNNVQIIQIDASVNPANSGGPLILPETGEVVGIVTRKATGLTQMFKELRGVLLQNLRVLQAARGGGGSIRMMGIDPLEVAEASQSQVLQLLGEIERSANVGIGYAFSAAHLLEDNMLHDVQ